MSWFPHSQVSRGDGIEAADIRMLAVGYASGKVWGALTIYDRWWALIAIC